MKNIPPIGNNLLSRPSCRRAKLLLRLRMKTGFVFVADRNLSIENSQDPGDEPFDERFDSRQVERRPVSICRFHNNTFAVLFRTIQRFCGVSKILLRESSLREVSAHSARRCRKRACTRRGSSLGSAYREHPRALWGCTAEFPELFETWPEGRRPRLAFPRPADRIRPWPGHLSNWSANI